MIGKNPNSWFNQQKFYVIQYQSRITGGTFVEVRRTKAGRDRLVNTLKYMGYNDNEIIESVSEKEFKPDPEKVKEIYRKAAEKRSKNLAEKKARMKI